MKAVVLSGGGGKGAYQIGVWKALKRMDYKYEIVTGTSVGALNGALMVQKDYLRSLWLWSNMSFNTVFEKDMLFDLSTLNGKTNLLKEYAKSIIVEGGMDPINLEKLIKKCLNPKKFYNSTINYGLVTVSVPSLKPKMLTKKDIPKDKIHDYLMASASCYPAFKMKEIDNMSFIDGGVYDNLPINLAIKMGATEIIAVDLRSIGLKRKVENKNINITLISPRNNIGSFLVFDRHLSNRALKLGYNDTMKTFGLLDGDKYTFKKNELNKMYMRVKTDISNDLKNIFSVKSITLIGELIKNATYKKIIDDSSNIVLEKIYNKNIEYLAKVFDIPETKIYNTNTYHKELLNRFEEIDNKEITNKIKANDIKSLLNTKIIVEYIYNKLKNMSNNKDKKELQNIAVLFPKELVAALYLNKIVK